MTNEELIALCREVADLCAEDPHRDGLITLNMDEMHRLVERVAGDEREACAKVCDEQASRSETSMLKAKSVKTRDIYSAAGQTAHWMTQAIRARGNHAGG